MPARTGEAGAIHRGGFFAGMPAPHRDWRNSKECG
jgi:hypothetical protein